MIYILTNIGLAAVPSVLIIVYIYRKDRGRKEPKTLVFASFVFGFFAVVPAILIELIFSALGSSFTGIFYILFRAFVIAALVEEGVKLAVVRLYLYPRKAFDEVSDGIFYTIAASLGFAFFENILYSFGSPLLMLIRGATAVPLHVAASGILGYYIGMTKITGKKQITKGLLSAVLIHGLYDFLLFTDTLLGLLVIPLLVGSIFALRSLYRKAQRFDLGNTLTR